MVTRKSRCIPRRSGTWSVVEDHESGEVFRVEVPKFARIRDLIVTKGHSNSGLYFISRGEVEVIVHDDEEEQEQEARKTARPKILLTEGDYFGEVSLLLNTPATATIEAVSFCDIFYISGQDFHLVKEASPDIEQTLRDARKELFDKVGDKAGDKETKKEKRMEEEEKQNAASSSSSIMSA